MEKVEYPGSSDVFTETIERLEIEAGADQTAGQDGGGEARGHVQDVQVVAAPARMVPSPARRPSTAST